MKVRLAVALMVITVLSIILIEPATEAGSRNSNSEIIINVVGDVHGESAIKRDAIPALKKHFADGDLNIFNLETAITGETEKQVKAYNFKTNLAFLKLLKSVGFNVASIANNHSYDYGKQGFLDTLQNLDKAGISYVGGGVNSGIAYQGQIYQVKGLKIGVLGFAKVNGGPDSIATKDRPGTTNGYDTASSEAAITRMKTVSDLLIVLTHWGEEGTFTPRTHELATAKKWKELGADIIVGSHTHTLQPVTLSENKLVAYSMGNFIFYSSQLENRRTAILKIRISPKRQISYSVEPFVINNLTKVPEAVVASAKN